MPSSISSNSRKSLKKIYPSFPKLSASKAYLLVPISPLLKHPSLAPNIFWRNFMDMEGFPGNLFPQSILLLHRVSGSIFIFKMLISWKQSLQERGRFRKHFALKMRQWFIPEHTSIINVLLEIIMKIQKQQLL
jgi:hypothetical protein